MKRGPRWIHKLYAEAMGYFWMPCPVCGRMFGGHEWAATIELAPGKGQGVCSADCADQRGEWFYTRRAQ